MSVFDQDFVVPKEEHAIPAVEEDVDLTRLIRHRLHLRIVLGAPLVLAQHLGCSEDFLAVDGHSDGAGWHLPGREVRRPQNESAVRRALTND